LNGHGQSPTPGSAAASPAIRRDLVVVLAIEHVARAPGAPATSVRRGAGDQSPWRAA
jgi:hypothetical protein